MTLAPEIPTSPSRLSSAVLVRDVMVAAVGMSVVSLAWQDRATTVGVAAGGAVAVISLRWMARAVEGAGAGGLGANMAIRLSLQFVSSTALFFGLLLLFPRFPALVGFSSLLVGFGVRGFLGLRDPARNAMRGAQNIPPASDSASFIDSSSLSESP